MDMKKYTILSIALIIIASLFMIFATFSESIGRSARILVSLTYEAIMIVTLLFTFKMNSKKRS